MIQHPRLFAFALTSFLGFAGTTSFGQKMYWLTTEKVQRADLDGSNVEDLFANDFTSTRNIAVDHIAGKIYWSQDIRIRRANLDGSSIEDVLLLPGSLITTISVDSEDRDIYWFDFTSGSLRRANYDGSNIETIVVYGWTWVSSLAVDRLGGKVYWSRMEPGEILRVDLGGSTVETVVPREDGALPHRIAIDSGGGKLYWTDVERDEIRRANLDGSGVEIIVAGDDRLSGIGLDVVKGKMYWAARERFNESRGEFLRANLDGTDVETVLDGQRVLPFGVSSSGIALDPVMGKLYWPGFNNRQVLRVDLDGSNIETILSRVLQGPSDLALDLLSKSIYWTDRSFLTEFLVQRSKLDGVAFEGLVVRDVRMPGANSMALDRVAKKVYWLRDDILGTQLQPGTIYRANFDGSDAEEMLADAFFGEGGLALDVAAGKMYWTDTENMFLEGKIRRANLDGSDVEEILSTEIYPRHGFTIDLTARKMYWTKESHVLRANLDGTAVEDVVQVGSFMMSELVGIEVDPVNRKIYWLDRRTNRIQCANQDGSNIEDLVDGVEGLVAMALDLGCGGVDCQVNGVGDECESDTDGDGLIDDCDTCPSSDVRLNVFVNSCETLVPNQLLDNGCSMNDQIAGCQRRFLRRNDFPRCVGDLARSWKRRGLITGRQLGMILRCVGRQGNLGRASDPGAKTESRD